MFLLPILYFLLIIQAVWVHEADSVAASIIEFATFLQSSGLDVKFAVVGF